MSNEDQQHAVSELRPNVSSIADLNMSFGDMIDALVSRKRTEHKKRLQQFNDICEAARRQVEKAKREQNELMQEIFNQIKELTESNAVQELTSRIGVNLGGLKTLAEYKDSEEDPKDYVEFQSSPRCPSSENENTFGCQTKLTVVFGAPSKGDYPINISVAYSETKDFPEWGEVGDRVALAEAALDKAEQDALAQQRFLNTSLEWKDQVKSDMVEMFAEKHPELGEAHRQLADAFCPVGEERLPQLPG